MVRAEAHPRLRGLVRGYCGFLERFEGVSHGLEITFTPLGALAGEVGWSRRHLAVRCRQQLGMPPKTVARILRFERVVRLLGHDDGGRLAEIAYDCRFSDQAHLNRDFRKLAGTTPSEYVGSPLPDGFGVAFVQDER